jgi:hypothetical protein
MFKRKKYLVGCALMKANQDRQKSLRLTEVLHHGTKWYIDQGVMCPECESTDLTIDSPDYGNYLNCLQCHCEFKYIPPKRGTSSSSSTSPT